MIGVAGDSSVRIVARFRLAYGRTGELRSAPRVWRQERSGMEKPDRAFLSLRTYRRLLKASAAALSAWSDVFHEREDEQASVEIYSRS